MPDIIDIILRTIVVVATLLLAGLLVVTRRQRQAALPATFFCLAVAAFFVTSAPGANAMLDGWVYPLTALCVTKAVWFWLFARALFSDDAGLRAVHFGALGAVALAGTWQQLVFLPLHRAGVATSGETLLGFGLDGVLLGFVLIGLFEAWRDMAVDLVEKRRRLRLGFMVATGVYLALTLGVQSYNLILDVSTPGLAVHANMLAVAVGAFIAAALLLQPRQITWLDPSRTQATRSLSRTEMAVLAQLERMLETERVYLEEGLTIGALATRLNTGEHVLRRVVNRGMGHSNFNDFLHTWRIREACEELVCPEHARQPVLAIAMKVGYGSIGAFNRAFKARVGMTPTAYRRSGLESATHAS